MDLMARILVLIAVSTLKSSDAGIAKPKKAKPLLAYNQEKKTFVLDSGCLVEISKLDAPILVLSAVGDVELVNRRP